MITLFDFQRKASTQISERYMEYLGNEVSKGTRKNPQWVPFFQSLAALTGAGKTVILADAVAQMSAATEVAPVILWLSRGRVVVAQSYANLQAGGKYHHLLGNANVRPLSEYSPSEVEVADTPSLFFATVGTFNRKDMEQGSLTIYKSDIDGTGTSTWTALGERLTANGVKRPLFIVYDEAHNLSEQQTDLLLRLEPEAILLASATMQLPPMMAAEIQRLRDAGRSDDWLITRVSSKKVVDEALVKSAISMAGYKTPMEEAISALLADMAEAEENAAEYGVDLTPKAIYVCKTNVIADDALRKDDPRQPFGQRQAPPIQIWRYLVEQQGIDPATVAVYANLDTHKDYPLPEEFVLFRGADNDYDAFTAGDFTHIIFNLTLQEGWDDPSAYFAYIDKSMESTVQVTQVIGRVLRQPNATRFPGERLNTAHFYVRVDRNEVFNDIVGEVNKRLGSDLPDVKLITSTAQGARAKQLRPKLKREIPRTATDPTDAVAPVTKLLDSMLDYSEAGLATSGNGSRKVSMHSIGGGEGTESDWEDYDEPSRVSARWVFHREVMRLFARALDVASTADKRFDAAVGVGSAAYLQIRDLASKIVHAYIENVRLVQRKPNPYVVGPILAREGELESFNNALHAGYDGLNSLELTFARALDRTGLVWARNQPRSGYGIPLVSIGDTTSFYPDFILWADGAVLCIDTKGPQLLREDAGRKLLSVRPRVDAVPLLIRFISAGEYNVQLEKLSPDGHTVFGLKDDGKIRAQHFETLDELLVALTTAT